MPPSVNSLWINKPSGRYKSKRGKIFENLACDELKKQFRYKPLANSLKVSMRLYFKDKRKRDIDNYNKAILDSMTKIIYEDDSQIEELNVKKLVGCGYFRVVESKWNAPNGDVKVNYKTVVYQKGIEYISKVLRDLGYEKIEEILN